MSSIWGRNIKISVFGESHGPAIGVTIDGILPGIKLDMDYINKQMERRRPGKNRMSTSRNESDSVNIISGLFEGRTTGTPLCAIIKNSDKKSGDYRRTKNIFRPGHADYTGYVRYRGFNDYRGGGHFSGRLTAPIVFAGTVCRHILNQYGIKISSHIKSIKNINDKSFLQEEIDCNLMDRLINSEFPVIDQSVESGMKEIIYKAREEGDSVGGKIECIVTGISAGIGDPMFESVESVISHIMFSIPAVKGIEFGEGFMMSEKYGSECNDAIYADENGEIKLLTNRNGGINGGITNGMPILFTVAVKPTPSISKVQKSVNIETMDNEEISIKGRHDPCIVQRAIPVVESAAAIAVLDMLLEAEKIKGGMNYV